MTTAKNDVILLGYNLRGDIDFWWVGGEGEGDKNLVGGESTGGEGAFSGGAE